MKLPRTKQGRTKRAEKTRWISVPLTCSGTAMTRCRGTITLDVNGTIPAGSAPLNLVPGRTTVVRIRLTLRAYKLLLKKKRLVINVTTIVPDGLGETDLKPWTMTILAPLSTAKAKTPTKAPARKK